MGLFSQMRDWLRGDRRGARDLLADLVGDYRVEVEAAAHLRAHAEQAPYRQARETLLRLADAEDQHAALLRKLIDTLGATVPDVAPTIPSGLNHWGRMADAFERADEKRRRLLEQSIHWDVDHPEIAAALARLAREETGNRRLLEELVTRADSLALD